MLSAVAAPCGRCSDSPQLFEPTHFQLAAKKKEDARLEAEEAAKVAAAAAEEEARRAEEEAILSANPSQATMLREKGWDDAKIVEHLRNEMAEQLGGERAKAALKGTNKSNIDNVSSDAKQRCEL